MSEPFVPFMDGPDVLSVPCMITDIRPQQVGYIQVTFPRGCELVAMPMAKEPPMTWLCPRKDVTILKQSCAEEGLRARVKLRLEKELPDAWLVVLMDRTTERVMRVFRPEERVGVIAA